MNPKYQTGQNLLANHGMIGMWNLLKGDTVILDGKIATVHSDPVQENSDQPGWVDFVVYDIVENDETAPNGDWLATPRIVRKSFTSGDEVAFIQTSHIATRIEG